MRLCEGKFHGHTPMSWPYPEHITMITRPSYRVMYIIVLFINIFILMAYKVYSTMQIICIHVRIFWASAHNTCEPLSLTWLKCFDDFVKVLQLSSIMPSMIEAHQLILIFLQHVEYHQTCQSMCTMVCTNVVHCAMIGLQQGTGHPCMTWLYANGKDDTKYLSIGTKVTPGNLPQ